MPAAETFALFTVAAIGVLIIPGPAVAYIVARSVDQGRTVALASVAALGLGAMAPSWRLRSACRRSSPRRRSRSLQ